MHQLLLQGLQVFWQDLPIDDQLSSYPANFQNLFCEQCGIGWDQVYYGRISGWWAQYITYSSNYSTNGDLFYTKVVKILCQYILDYWLIWNQVLHSGTKQNHDAQVLAAQVTQLTETVQADPNVTQIAPTQEPDQILQCPIKMIHEWIAYGTSSYKIT